MLYPYYLDDDFFGLFTHKKETKDVEKILFDCNTNKSDKNHCQEFFNFFLLMKESKDDSN
jgi:hypothetical protein